MISYIQICLLITCAFLFFTDWKKGHSYQPLARHRRDIARNTERLQDSANYLSFANSDSSEHEQFLELSKDPDQSFVLDNNIRKIGKEIKNFGFIYADKTQITENTISDQLHSHQSDKDEKEPVYTNDKKHSDYVIQNAIPIHEIILGEKRPSSEETLLPGTSITRRKRWLEKYLQDIETGELDKKLHAQHEEMQKRRRKRSIASGVEGQSFINVSRIMLYSAFFLFSSVQLNSNITI